MARTIAVLPDVVANQIAAGEVVERPASIVKELIENAIDARATRVEVRIEGGGKRLVRVSDDGIGMGREDAVLCLDRHATSKIRSADDLRRIGSFGFRGEALPSIAAVTRLALETSDGEDAGTRLRVEGGKLVAVEDQPRRRGTTVEARALFFNAPARAHFLKSAATEARAVAEAVTALALAHPDIGFTFASDGQTLFDLPPTDDRARRIAGLWGEDAAATLIAVERREGELHVAGLIQRPDAAAPGVRRSLLLVNARPFREPALIRAADRGYRTTIPSGARPWLFVSFTVPGGTVDVNVHPAKAEVRFRDFGLVEAALEAAVRDALGRIGSSATLDRDVERPRLAVRERPPRGRRPDQGQTALFVPSSSADGAVEREAGEHPAPPGERPRLFQLHHTYILAETRDGLLVIDQHSAHERVLFERLMRAFGDGGQAGQRLLFPLTLRLSPLELQQVEELRGILARAGFEVEAFGGDAVILHAVPNPHPWFDAERCFREMVAELTHGSELVRSAKNQHERIAKTFACKGALKAGQKLSSEEMGELFEALFATELPWHDVHGRPTIVRLSSAELARKFGRA